MRRPRYRSSCGIVIVNRSLIYGENTVRNSIKICNQQHNDIANAKRFQAKFGSQSCFWKTSCQIFVRYRRARNIFFPKLKNLEHFKWLNKWKTSECFEIHTASGRDYYKYPVIISGFYNCYRINYNQITKSKITVIACTLPYLPGFSQRPWKSINDPLNAPARLTLLPKITLVVDNQNIISSVWSAKCRAKMGTNCFFFFLNRSKFISHKRCLSLELLKYKINHFT